MEIDSFNWPFLRPIVHRYNRRAVWHDYRSRCYYMITITAQPGVGAFSRVVGTPGDPANPPRTELTPLGSMIDEELRNLCRNYPELSNRQQAIMPDHIHFIAPAMHNSHRVDMTYERAQQLNDLARVIADGEFVATVKNQD